MEGGKCIDFDECNLGFDRCHWTQECVNTDGTYTCECIDGYEKIDTRCVDIDECSDYHCGSHSICLNTMGSYYCDCHTGYKYDETDNAICVDIDECTSNTHVCHEHADCHNNGGSYTCECHRPGFIDGGNGHVCYDIDECVGLNNDCEEVCINTIGSFMCGCKHGFDMNPDKVCRMDECILGIHDCNPMATCVDTPLAFDCVCPDGYEGDGRECNNANECNIECNHWTHRPIDCPIEGHKCHAQANCTDTEGSYECVCNEGYGCKGRQSIYCPCDNIDECEFSHINDCVEHSNCTDTEGSYICQCLVGFTGDALDKCIDNDECENGDFDCVADNEVCENTIGSYRCACNPGYEKEFEDELCLDIDECLDISNCGLKANCTNSPGSYECNCFEGYEQNERGRCHDIDECLTSTNATETNNCHDDATCTNMPGSFKCKCHDGYEGDGVICEEVDLCANHTCGEEGTCISLFGSMPRFTCSCNKGYYDDSYVSIGPCKDKNECAINEHDCVEGTNTICENTVG